MAISLKNVDDRLKVVEAKTPPDLKPKLIWKGSATKTVTNSEIGKYQAFYCRTNGYASSMIAIRGAVNMNTVATSGNNRCSFGFTISGNTITINISPNVTWLTGMVEIWTIGY